ncbi:MAG: energy transducer TonB [Candidatus Kapabacteria bacterium]|nr:energy transducer TonB [Candidatus Kapabacteria bacterium]MDW8225026.1 energy transducer TonB [Bacteroidota bacterium]
MQSSRESSLTIRIPWDRITARAFLLSLLVHICIFLLALHLRWYPEPPRQLEVRSIPVELLTLGWGEGNKPAGGNLSPEGRAYREKPRDQLADANTVRSRPRAITQGALEPTQAIPHPASETPTKAMNNLPSEQKSVPQGALLGSPQGSGLGVQGGGTGKGLGFDIEWGGGGNRIVLSKVLPQYPRGHNVAGRVRLRFTVLPDGTVGAIIPLQRTDPVLERAAIEALRLWRFNSLSTSIEMFGVITFTFELQ